MNWLHAALILVFFVPAVSAAGKKWTVDDVVLAPHAAGFEFAPNGRSIVWVRSTMDEEKGERISQLMRTDLDDLTEIELTRGQESCLSPRWSPDGKKIAFLTDRPLPKPLDKRRTSRRGREEDEKKEPTSQIWVINPFGGEAWPVTDFPREVSSFDWSGPEHLVFIAQEEKSHFETATDDDKKDTSQVVEDEKHEPPARLFRVEVKTHTVKRLTDNIDQIEYLAASPDGKWAVARHNRSVRYLFDAKIKPVLRLHNLDDQTSQLIFTDKKFNISNILWQPDSRGFLATNEDNTNPQFPYPNFIQVFQFDVADMKEKLIDLGWSRSVASQDANESIIGLSVLNDAFFALLADGARPRLARFTRQRESWKRDWIEGDDMKNVFGLAVSHDGKSIVYAHSTASKPLEWRYAPLADGKLGAAKSIMTLSDHVKDLPFAKSEVIRWKGALEEEVEGILYYPHDYVKGKKYPCVVMIHGGPAAADLDMWDESWAYAPNLYCQRGAFVFRPNYHGSSYYGQKFMESIAGGKYYELEVPDIEKGVDHLIAKGLVDADKLGVIGWSNGAILGIELTVATTRYKAASVGAGDVDWVSDWGNCEFGESFDHFYFGKTPLDDPKLYQSKSPFYRLPKCKTPTLIFFGTDDRTVPTQQVWMHYRGLQQLGKTDVRFVLFPGEKHSPKKLVHQRRKLQEELAWFDKHLFQTPKEESEALKDDSPLAAALKREAAARDKNRVGMLVKQTLVPEIVEHEGKSIGRFEITRAQYQAFDAKYPLGNGVDNYPATGITFEQAKAYCMWLSKANGSTYRLPTVEEGDDLYGKTDATENTLDHWAGYAVNPDDAKKLLKKIESLGTQSLLFEQTGVKAPLVREVGKMKAVGEAGVFDLGGNVAEWVTTENGKGKLMGGSADQPADAKTLNWDAGLEYRGFRVVREEGKKSGNP